MNQNLQWYTEQLGLTDATLTPLVHAAAMVAVVYKVDLQDSDPSILKLCDLPRHYERELAALTLFSHVPFVPRVQGFVPPVHGTSGAILMEYIPGMVLSECLITEAAAYELGTVLAKIHSTHMKAGGASASEYFMQKFEEHVSECADNLSAALLQKCRQYYDMHCEQLRAIDGPCMVHGDFHPGNIMVEHGRLSGIIDWATAHDGFAEEDLYLIEGGAWNLDAKKKGAFLHGYGTIRPLPDYQTMMPLLKLNKRLAIIGFIVRTDTWNTKHAQTYRTMLHSLEALVAAMVK